MSRKSQRQAERRRGVRVSPKGTVILLAGEDTCRCRIVNLGHGGVLMTAPARTGATLAGRSVEIELRLDGKTSEWQRLTGRILRADGSSIAMAFDAVPPGFSLLVEATESSSYGHKRILSVITVDATSGRRGPIAEAFRSAGCTVIEVSTPLEAIVRLGEQEFEPDLIVIADSVPSSTSDELRQFVQREHPRAKLVVVGDDVNEPAGWDHWLSATDLSGDLVARVRRLLIPSA